MNNRVAQQNSGKFSCWPCQKTVTKKMHVKKRCPDMENNHPGNVDTEAHAMVVRQDKRLNSIFSMIVPERKPFPSILSTG